MSRRAMTAGALAVVALVAAAVLLLGPSGSSSGRGTSGRPAPLFTTFDLQGHPVALTDLRGRRVVLNFWASWCQPCRAEFPLLKRLEANHPDVAVLGVVFQDGDGSARAFLQAQHATWPGLRDPNGSIADAYGVHTKPGIPVSILVGPDDTIRGRHLGALADQAAVDSFIALSPVH